MRQFCFGMAFGMSCLGGMGAIALNQAAYAALFGALAVLNMALSVGLRNA